MSRDARYFDDFLIQIRALSTRPEIELEEAPAPQKLAPSAFAIIGDVALDEESDVATGRFVLLYDPQTQDAWDGNFRCVTFVRAAIDHDMANDQMLADVGWSWLQESLTSTGAQFRNISGTVTKVASKSFGQLIDVDDDSEIEIRASWTPTDPARLITHAEAWLSLLEITSGLTPIPEGVASLSRSRK